MKIIQSYFNLLEDKIKINSNISNIKYEISKINKNTFFDAKILISFIAFVIFVFINFFIYEPYFLELYQEASLSASNNIGHININGELSGNSIPELFNGIGSIINEFLIVEGYLTQDSIGKYHDFLFLKYVSILNIIGFLIFINFKKSESLLSKVMLIILVLFLTVVSAGFASSAYCVLYFIITKFLIIASTFIFGLFLFFNIKYSDLLVSKNQKFQKIIEMKEIKKNEEDKLCEISNGVDKLMNAIIDDEDAINDVINMHFEKDAIKLRNKYNHFNKASVNNLISKLKENKISEEDIIKTIVREKFNQNKIINE